MLLAMLFLLWPLTATEPAVGKVEPTPSPKAVRVVPTLPPRPAPQSYELCEKALDQVRRYCEDSFPTYCEQRVPKLPKE